MQTSSCCSILAACVLPLSFSIHNFTQTRVMASMLTASFGLEDCNNNGIDDTLDIESGSSPDCQPNGVPDECDRADGTSADCNSNTIPDECDIQGETSSDCNGNDVPDECDLATTVDLTSPSLSPIGTGQFREYTVSAASLPAALGDVILTLSAAADLDLFEESIPVILNGSFLARVFQNGAHDCPELPDTEQHVIPIAEFNAEVAGGAAQFIMQASSSVDPMQCEPTSFITARIQYDRTPWSQDLNGNGVPEECEGDCNYNGVQDDIDIANGTSQDCNTNEVPDECEWQVDCNENDVPDACDLDDGTSEDCDESGIPDECEADCNANGLHDVCDVEQGTSYDCDGSGVPDECEMDCNGNGLHDSCDIADGTSDDDDENTVPDECQNTLHVPSDLYPTIADAIEAAGDGDVVLLADGTYSGAGNKDLAIWGKILTVRSMNGPSSCIIDCGGEGRAFFVPNYLDPITRFEGLTITNGAPSSYNGGALNVAGRTTILNCIITDCTVAGSGGGIYGALAFPSKLAIKNCLITSNEAQTGGGVYSLTPNSTIINSTIVDNFASFRGGGTYIRNFDLTIRNAIFWGNSSGSGAQLFRHNSTDTISFSDMQDGLGGVGEFNAGELIWDKSNIDADPRFLDADAADHHLMDNSPCIDSGDPEYPPDTAETDLDNNPRLLDGDGDGNPIIDMGAYEFALPCPPDLDDDRMVGASDLAILLGNWGPNPGHPADFNGDDTVSAADLAQLLGEWGPCP